MVHSELPDVISTVIVNTNVYYVNMFTHTHTHTHTHTAHNGWLDTVHIPPLTQPTNNNQPLKLKIPPGGSTVLECKPNITDPSRPSITWLRNNTPLNDRNEHHTLLPQSYSLILHNFTLPLGTDVATYRCLLDGFEYYEAEIEREFRIRLAGEGDQESGELN